MKRCPKCGSSFTDVNLQYCVIDGARLAQDPQHARPDSRNAGGNVNFKEAGPTTLHVIVLLALLGVTVLGVVIVYQLTTAPAENLEATLDPPPPAPRVTPATPTPASQPVTNAPPPGNRPAPPSPGPTSAPPLPGPTSAATPVGVPRLVVNQSKRLSLNGLLKSNICVEAGDAVEIRAGGVVVLGRNVGRSGPAGRDNLERLPLIPVDRASYCIQDEFRLGTLLFRFTGESRWRLAGAAIELTAPRSGCLEFEVNDNMQADNQGAFNVEVTVRKPQ